VLHGLPTWPEAIDRVHVTRNRSSGGNRRAVVQVHTAPLVADQITTIDGVTVTSLAQTVLDLCRTVPLEQAVAAGDRALAYGMVNAVLAEKVREDALRDLGWQIVRWLWADLCRPGVIRDRVFRAFARSSS
jgi:hypothetical protein